MKDYYRLLEVESTASADEIKRAFRGQIARYHPDKVQHLGQEFQAMAADRAAELTEAYRVLSDAGRRGEYDRARQAAGAAPAGAPPVPAASRSGEVPRSAPRANAAAAAAPAAAPVVEPKGEPVRTKQFSHERASRDAFVRRAVVTKLREALTDVLGPFEAPSVRGFDVVAVPRNRLFTRSRHPRLLGRFVPVVDRETLVEAWSLAGRWSVPDSEEVCVLLMGSAIAPARELADAIAKQRRQPQRGARVTVIPVDARDWQAHMPADAPPTARELLDRLRKGE